MVFLFFISIRFVFAFQFLLFFFQGTSKSKELCLLLLFFYSFCFFYQIRIELNSFLLLLLSFKLCSNFIYFYFNNNKLMQKGDTDDEHYRLTACSEIIKIIPLMLCSATAPGTNLIFNTTHCDLFRFNKEIYAN